MLRILIADDQRIFRTALKSTLEEQLGMLVTGEASDGQEALEMLSKDKYDLLLLDIAMPNKNGFEVLKETRLRFPSMPVLMLSSYSPEEFAEAALKAGASGYLSKDQIPGCLIPVIKRIYSLESSMSE